MPAPQSGGPSRRGHRHCCAEHGDGRFPAGDQRRVAVEHAQLLAPQHGDESRELGLEPIDSIVLTDVRRLEVQRQGARSHTEADPATMTRLQPRHLLGHQCGRSKRQEQRGGRGPPRGVLLQDERGHLQRLRHVPGEPAVVLTGHDPVEPTVQGETRLSADLADDGICGEFVVRVEPDRD